MLTHGAWGGVRTNAVGLNIGRAEALGAKLVFWDLGGQVGLRTIWEKYYGEAHAVVRASAAPLCPPPAATRPLPPQTDLLRSSTCLAHAASRRWGMRVVMGFPSE